MPGDRLVLDLENPRGIDIADIGTDAYPQHAVCGVGAATEPERAGHGGSRAGCQELPAVD